MIKFFFSFLFLILLNNYTYAIDTKASQAIIVDYNTDEVLFEKNSDIKIPPASMTKIMTVYVVFDRLKNTNLSIEDLCKISARAYRMKGSRMFVEIDTNVSINDLIKGIIIQSGNDASIAIAECLSGTEEDFAKLMNVYANKLGLKNTNFTNSSGWPDDNHYSTVRDIAILSNKMIKNFPNLYSYFQEKEFEYNNIKQPNRNRLLNNVNGSDGLKTGFTKKSGWAIAASTFRENRRITIVISGTNSSRSRLQESENLINWAFRETTNKKILSKNQIIKEVDVWLGNKPKINLIVKNDINTILSFDQMQQIESNIEYTKPISAPFKKGDILGKMYINIPGKDIKTIPLVADQNVDIVNPFFRFIAGLKYLLFGSILDE